MDAQNPIITYRPVPLASQHVAVNYLSNFSPANNSFNSPLTSSMPTFCHEFSPLLVVTPMHTPMVLEEQENEEETHQSVDQQEDGVFDLDEDIGDDDFEEEESVDSEEQDAINEIMQRVDQLKKDGDKRNKMLGEMIKKNSTTNALY